MDIDPKIIGMGQSVYTRHPREDQGIHNLLRDALLDALEVANLSSKDVDGLAIASFSIAPDSAIDIAWKLGLNLKWLLQDTNGGSSAMNMLGHASRAIKTGAAENILILAGDATGLSGYAKIANSYNTVTRDHLAPIGHGGPNGVYALVTNRQMKKYNIDKSLKVIMFLGRIHYIKGNDFLIKGFAEALNYRKDLFLVLVGPDDGHMDECKIIVEELGIKDSVLFTGFLGGEHKNSALVDADIVVQLSRFEQGAWAPLEGVLCKTPIIVTADTGTGEDVKRINAGYLVNFDDNQGLGNMIINLLENYDDAIELTLAARKFIIENLSMNARIHEYTDLYN